MQALNKGESKESILKRFPISARTLDRYIKVLKKANKVTKETVEVGADKTLAEKKPSGGAGLVEVKPTPADDSKLPPGDGDPPGQKMAAVVMRPPAPIIFTLGQCVIELEPQALYESFLLYEDMKGKRQLKDPFSTVLLDAMGIVWRLIASEPVIKDGQVKTEVNLDGRSQRPSDEQIGTGEAVEAPR